MTQSVSHSSRPATAGPRLRAWATLTAVAFAIAAPAVQAWADLGLSQSEFSAQGDQTLRAAGYAFSLWSLIYLGLVATALWQLRKSREESATRRTLAWPGAIAAAGCGAWILASASNAQWLSVTIIVGSAAVLAAALARHGSEMAGASAGDRWLVAHPYALLGGWLVAASALNILMVLTAQELITPAPLWGVAGVLAVAVVGAGVAWAARNPVYPLPIAWGLAGVFVAERADNPAPAWTAVAGAVVMLAVAVIVTRRR